MAADRFITRLDDLTLTMEFITDGGSMALVEYEYVDSAGSGFEDLGPNAMECSAVAYFNKSDYENWREFERIALMRNTVHSFMHPARGLISVRISNWTIRHDDRIRLAVVNFTLREELQGNDDQISPLIAPSIEDLFTAGQTAAVDSFAAKASETLGGDAAAVTGREVDPGTSLTAQFIDQSWAVRKFVLSVETAVTKIEGFLGSVTQPANTLIAAIDYGTTLPGRIIGAIAATIDRYGSLVSTVTGSPYAILQSFYQGTLELRNAVTGFESEIDTIRAQYGALLCAKLFAADDENRAIALTVEKTPAWNSAGDFVGSQEVPYVMSVNDLERVLYIVRMHLQQAIDANRSVSQLSDMAVTLLKHVNNVKMQRERIVQIDVTTSIPLLLLCHQRGLGYNAADRVMTINRGIKNPSFVQGVISIYE